MEKNAFNLEYFKSIRQEINERIKIHYTVLATKYIATGGVFSFLWKYATTAEWEAGIFVAASLLSFLLDVLLLENLGWIKRAGAFVEEHVESCLGTVAIYPDKQGIMKWEHYGAQPRGQWTCFSPLG